MTLRSISLRLLRYIGVSSLDPADNDTSLLERGIAEGDLEHIVLCVNGAFQEIFDNGPSWLSERPRGSVLRPPTSITFTVTEYGTTIAGVTGWQSWMQGCTVRVGGDTLDNQLMSSTELMRPYMGGTGTVTGMVHCDSLPMPSDVRAVLDPVELPNNARLHVAASAEEFRTFNGISTFNGYGAQQHPFAHSSAYNLYNKSVGEPVVAYMDTAFDAATGHMPIFLRFNPMPGQAYAVSYRVKIKPPTFTVLDIDSGDHTTDPATVIPIDYVESVLWPVVLQRFTAHPHFKAEGETLREIARQYEAAMVAIKNTKPGISRTRAIYGQG